jgi:hypothetical protein
MEDMKRLRRGSGARRWAVVLAATCLSGFAAEGGERDPGVPAGYVLTVMQQNSTTCPRGVHAAMRVEVEALLWPAGIEIDWREYNPRAIAPSVCALVSLRFTTEQPKDGKHAAVRARRHLGWTHMTEGDILPYCVVDWKRVEMMTAPYASGKPVILCNEIVGRALGRVVAHEIYHVVTRTAEHSLTGVAQPRLTPEDLAAARCCFDDAALARMRRVTSERVCLGQYSVPRFSVGMP